MVSYYLLTLGLGGLLFTLRDDKEPQWENLLIPALVVPDTALLNHLLRRFQVEKRHMAVVVDE